MSEATSLKLAQLREPHYERLPTEKMRLYHDGSGCLRLTIEGSRSYRDVKVVRAFPFSEPERYIALLDGFDKVIGLLDRVEDLQEDSQKVAEESLRQHYFIPTIKTVTSLKEQFGAVYMDVETDRGDRHFVAKGLRDAIVHLGDGELLIADVDGNRYRIADLRQLDPKSRRFLELVV